MRDTQITGDNMRDGIDKYFLRSKDILKAENINPIVRFQVFARKNAEKLEGLDKAVNFIIQERLRSFESGECRIFSLRDGQRYTSGEPMMLIEGPVQELIDLETKYLQITSGGMTGDIDLNDVRRNASAIKDVSKDKKLLYFGARHYAPELDEEIAKICFNEGFDGCSTDIGAKAWGSKGIGTTPHALILAFQAQGILKGEWGNPFLKMAECFDKHIDKSVPRVFLIDTYNLEILHSVFVSIVVPSTVGVRIDTCGENYAEGARRVKLPPMPIDTSNRKGVSVAAVWALRQGLDWSGYGEKELTVSSGFNAKKTKDFMVADKCYQDRYGKPLFDAIGTGSLTKAIMTTSDIVACKNNVGDWVPLSKLGRGEVESDRLMEVKI
jgi:nicotinate phosphoribosyltransferase